MSFNASEHTLHLTFSKVKQVLYTIRYEVPEVGHVSTASMSAQADKVTQALTHRSLADSAGVVAATHFLGSESGDQKIKHEIRSGVIQAQVITSAGSRERIVKQFTITEANQVLLTDRVVADTELRQPEVLGASSAGSLSYSSPSPTTLVTVSPDTDSKVPRGVPSGLGWALMVLAGLVLMLVVVVLFVKQRDNSSQAS